MRAESVPMDKEMSNQVVRAAEVKVLIVMAQSFQKAEALGNYSEMDKLATTMKSLAESIRSRVLPEPQTNSNEGPTMTDDTVKTLDIDAVLASLHDYNIRWRKKLQVTCKPTRDAIKAIQHQAAELSTLRAENEALRERNAEVEAEQEKRPIWFMWRPEGKIPTIKGPFMTTSQALKFASELYEINKVNRVSVLDGWMPNKLGGDSIENFMAEFGDRRTSAYKKFYSDDAKSSRSALSQSKASGLQSP